MPRAKPQPDQPAADTPVVPTKPTENEVLGEFARLGQALMAAADDHQKAKGAADQLEALLTKLSPKDYPGLADNPAVLQFVEQITARKADASGDPPGTIYNRNSLAQYKKPWRWSDLTSDKVPWVFDQTPTKTQAVTWNNLTVQFFADQPWTGPRCFWDQLAESRRAERVAHEHASYMFKTGGVPSDPTIINEGTRRVRAQSSAPQGTDRGFVPGSGVGNAFYQGQAETEEAEGEPEPAAA